ncbi:hypothetical protein BJV78DRAFT_1243207 [Lactifluus subvellereus]|nr:hypothetical protein BJV78DRAFT_1243124 [Lactifluus subvellereus]KAI0247689.1 hypothetical protein BJV78DRAFT_1243207 [Lactifluus subvellereus]
MSPKAYVSWYKYQALIASTCCAPRGRQKPTTLAPPNIPPEYLSPSHVLDSSFHF